MSGSNLPPDTEQIQQLAAAALAALPDPFRQAAAGVGIVVDDFPDDALLKDMAMEDGWDLTGLYQGVPLTEKSVIDQDGAPDMIRLFRLPILLEWIERGDVALDVLVTHVLVHELAHHFGWSDDDIAAIDRWWT